MSLIQVIQHHQTAGCMYSIPHPPPSLRSSTLGSVITTSGPHSSYYLLRFTFLSKNFDIISKSFSQGKKPALLLSCCPGTLLISDSQPLDGHGEAMITCRYSNHTKPRLELLPLLNNHRVIIIRRGCMQCIVCGVLRIFGKAKLFKRSGVGRVYCDSNEMSTKVAILACLALFCCIKSGQSFALHASCKLTW